MLDNYIPRPIDDPQCNLKNYTTEKDAYCPVVLETTLLNAKYKYPLVDAVTQDHFGIFSNDSRDDGSLKQFLNSVTSFSLTYNIRVDYNAYVNFEDSCFDWTIK
jgi:hypothetical protein